MKKIAVIFIILILIVSFAFIIQLSKNNNTFVNETVSEIEKEETPVEDSEKYLLGSYEWEPGYPTTACVFYFDKEGNVIWYSDAYSEGTYKIENDKVVLSIDKTIGPDNYIVPDAVKELILNIVDENTLSDASETLFHKTSDENEILLKDQ